MANRSFSFAPGEYYHCYNRGVDKRTIFTDTEDFQYFMKQIHVFNTADSVKKLRLQISKEAIDPPVEILSYCLLPNHYHLLLRCNTDRGVSQFMQRLGTGFTMYFNKRHARSGALFQGQFKANHISDDQSLKQVAAYVYYNHVIHAINNPIQYRHYLHPTNELVRGWTSDYGTKHAQEIVAIIKELRSARLDLAQ